MRHVAFVKVNHFRDDDDLNNKCIIIPKDSKQSFQELILTSNDGMAEFHTNHLEKIITNLAHSMTILLVNNIHF